MKTKFWQKLLFNAVSACLISSPLLGVDSNPSSLNQMISTMLDQTDQNMTENDLLQQLSAQDKATYQKLSPEGKALVLKMANTGNNKSADMMQNCLATLRALMTQVIDEVQKNVSQMRNNTPQSNQPSNPTPPSQPNPSGHSVRAFAPKYNTQ